MTIPAFHVEAKLHAFRKTQDGVVVSFVVSPIDMPQALALDPLGTRYMLALCAIGDDERPIPNPTRHLPAPVVGDRSGATAGETASKFKSPGERSVIRAALLPRDERFRAWAAQPGFRPMTEEQAEDFIRIRCCDGNSRRLIAEVPEYMDRFLAMETEFKMDVGEMARPR